MHSHDFSFTQDHTDAGAVSKYLNPLPRSISRPNEHILLDGEWRFELDHHDCGIMERWYLGHDYPDTTTWPTSIEQQISSARSQHQASRDGHQGSPWSDEVIAWYEREFTIPPEWLDAPGLITQLTFGACGYETQVWLNGHQLRTVEGELVHLGEYTSFSYELPAEYLRPVNRLTVRTADSLDAEITRGKQESRVYKRGGIWYQTISGPVRSVWIEPVKRNRLRSRLSIISTIEDCLVEFVLTTLIHDPGIYTLRVVVARRGSNDPIAVDEYKLPLPAGQKQQRLMVELPEARLWSADDPNLYHLTAQLVQSDGSASEIHTHFGLRKVEARGRSIYINNQKVYLDGILYQPGTSSFEEMTRHMLAMKKLGCNLVRVHIAGIDPRIYDLADELGMFLWVEVPSPHSSTQRSRDNHWAELQRMLVIIGSHPSIIICSLYNEDWGAQDIAFNALTREYIARTYSYLRVNYPQFLVVDNDGWRHVSTEGRIESHLLTAHVYTPEIKKWSAALDRLIQGRYDGVTAEAFVVGDPFFYRGQVPLVVSEWGGFGFTNYGGPEDADARADRITAFKRELRRRPIAGDVYTQAISIEEETNGLIDPQTGDLLVPEGLLRSAPQLLRGRRKGRGQEAKGDFDK